MQTVFQATRVKVLLRTSPVHRKFLQMLIMFLITVAGIGKIFSQNWTFPNRTDRSSSKRPAYKRCLPIHPWTDDCKSCRSGENLIASSLWGLRGTPRYVKGNCPSLKPEVVRIECLWIEPTPPKKMNDFCGLMSKLKSSQREWAVEGYNELKRGHHEREVKHHLQKQGEWYLVLHI
jgi:hypothetical protein